MISSGISYLHRTHIDPCNLLIGSQANPSLLEKCVVFRRSFGEPLKISELQNFFLEYDMRPPEYIHQLALSYQKRLQACGPGSIVLVPSQIDVSEKSAQESEYILPVENDHTQGYRFARCLFYDNDQMFVTCDPFETPGSVISISFSSVLIIPTALLNKDVTDFSSLVPDLLQPLYKLVEERAIGLILEWFEGNGVERENLELGIRLEKYRNQYTNITFRELRKKFNVSLAQIIIFARLSSNVDRIIREAHEDKGISSILRKLISSITLWTKEQETSNDYFNLLSVRDRMEKVYHHLPQWITFLIMNIKKLLQNIATYFNSEFENLINFRAQDVYKKVPEVVFSSLKEKGYVDGNALSDTKAHQKSVRMNLQVLANTQKNIKQFVLDTSHDLYRYINDIYLGYLEILSLESGKEIRELRTPQKFQEVKEIILDKDFKSKCSLTRQRVIMIIDDLELLLQMRQTDRDWYERGGEGRGHDSSIHQKIFEVLEKLERELTSSLYTK
jgi:ribosomal protein S8